MQYSRRRSINTFPSEIISDLQGYPDTQRDESVQN